ncbi:MAG: plastocyanin/azurin family copper-binding protein [Nitrospinaceae bacterium]
MKSPRLSVACIFLWMFFVKPGHAQTVEIDIIKSKFVPPVVRIKQGDTVRFVNKENLLHTVTSGKAPVQNDRFHSGFLILDMKFETTLQKPGVIDYFCLIHSHTMRGTLIVEKK